MKIIVGVLGIALVAVLAGVVFMSQQDQPSPDTLEELPKRELYERARRAGVDGRSRMTKAELVAVLRNSA